MDPRLRGDDMVGVGDDNIDFTGWGWGMTI